MDEHRPAEGPETGKSPAATRRRRWPFVVLGVVVVAVLAGVWGWYVWLPGYRPSLQAGERYGVDVSHHQGEIAWGKVADDGIAFTYIKATEGGDFVDESFERNWEGASAAGLDHGAYHFFTLCRPGEVQAENFLRTVPDGEGTLPPAVDLELAGNCSERPDRAWVERELGTFLDMVEAASGETVVLYIGDDFESHYGMREQLERPIWHRRVLIRPDVEDWWIWQIHGYASVDGIDGGVDLNIMREPPARPGDTGPGNGEGAD